MKSLTKRAVVCGLIVILGLLSALPTVLPVSVARQLPAWYADTTLSLGLDLRGGSQLLLTVDTAAVVQDEHQQLADQLGDQLRENRLSYRTLTVGAEGLVVTLRMTMLSAYPSNRTVRWRAITSAMPAWPMTRKPVSRWSVSRWIAAGRGYLPSFRLITSGGRWPLCLMVR